MYDININGIDYPILPTNVGINSSNNRIINTDSIPVINIFTTIYKTRFLADTNKPISVYINDDKLTYGSDYNILYLNDDVAYGVNIIAVINPGDVISISYTLPIYDDHGIVYEPYNFLIDKKIDPPHIIDTSLHYGNYDTVLIGSGSSMVPYLIGDYCKKVDYVDTNGKTYNCWFVPATNIASGTIVDPVIPNMVQISSNETGYVFRCGDWSIDPQHRYYAGIFNESITKNQSGDYLTKYEYRPGSITLVLDGMDTDVTEYDKTITANKKQYTLDDSQKDRSGAVVSYCPIDLKDAISNIKDHNMVEYFESTQNGTLSLKSSVYVDYNIVSDTISSKPNWFYADGVFILLDNTKVSYEPIRIKVGNRYAVNKTNYSGDDPGKNMEVYDSKYNNIQYYHKGNQIFFNTNIINTIEVYYYRSVAELKLKITMINPSKTNNFVTPELYEYAIMFDMRD